MDTVRNKNEKYDFLTSSKDGCEEVLLKLCKKKVNRAKDLHKDEHSEDCVRASLLEEVSFKFLTKNIYYILYIVSGWPRNQ